MARKSKHDDFCSVCKTPVHWLNASIEGKRMSYYAIRKVLLELSRHNPYPKDIFTGETEEGMRGVAARHAYNCCLQDIQVRVIEYLKNKKR